MVMDALLQYILLVIIGVADIWGWTTHTSL